MLGKYSSLNLIFTSCHHNLIVVELSYCHSATPRFQDLLERIPDEVRGDRYCSHLLSLLAGHAHHSVQVGPNEWSKKKLIGILSTLRPWELRCPETAAAVKVCHYSAII